MSPGSIAMIVLSLLVLGGSVLVFARLSGGVSVDLNAVASDVVNLVQRAEETRAEENTPGGNQSQIASGSAGNAASGAAARVPDQEQPAGADTFTMTVGGVIQLAGEVRKNSRSADSKKYDYSDVLMLLQPYFDADLNGVFLENILSDTEKISDVVAPANVAEALKQAGIGMAACGFPRAFELETKGISETRSALTDQSILPIGIREADEQSVIPIRNVNGYRVALLQYTGGVSASVRKNMTKEDLTDMIPEAEEEQIAAEIRTAREQGAQAVVVLLNWGKTGKSPDTNQVSLAAKIAEAGADLIIGAGSRQLQGAEYLAGPEGRQVLCCWSLGSLITGDRGNVRRIAGYLLHVTFSRDGDRARLQKAEYTPVYAWKFKQDGSFFYRCVAANQPAPDGMDNEQQKYMANALQIAETALAGSPVLQRTGKGGD